MSIGQTFPDAVVLPGNRIKVVTIWARGWLRSNTCNDYKCEGDVPKIMDIDGEVAGLVREMRGDGLIVCWKRPRH